MNTEQQISGLDSAEYAKFMAGESLPVSLRQMSEMHGEITRYQGEISAINDDIARIWNEYYARIAPLNERASKLRFLVKQTQKELKKISEECGGKVEELLKA